MLRENEIQTRAIESVAKTVLIRGRPGTGKTDLLARRFEHLVSFKNQTLPSILVFTFSSASAELFRRMLNQRIKGSYDELCVHTFHSFSMEVISTADMGGQQPLFLSPFKEYLTVKEVLRRQGLNLRSHCKEVAGKDGFARELSDFFKLLKQNLLYPDEFAGICRGLTEELDDLAHLYDVFEALLRERNYFGFPDVVARAVTLLQSQPRLLHGYRQKFRHILIDEFEEIDPAQFQLLHLLLDEDTSLFVAGDEEQRIFGFRGSGAGRFGHIRRLRNCVEEHELQTDYRLPAPISSRAARFIGRSSILQTPDADGNASAVQAVRHRDPIEQAYAIARDIKKIIIGNSAGETSPILYSDFAIICRSIVASALPLQEAFSYYEIPYVLFSATGFYANPVIRFLVDAIKVLHSFDDDASLERVLNIPVFGLDCIELKRVTKELSGPNSSGLYRALKVFVSNPEQHGAQRQDFVEKLAHALHYLEKTKKKIEKGETPAAAIRTMMRELFFGEILERELEHGVRDAENLRVFDQVLADIEDVCSPGNQRIGLGELVENIEHSFAHFSDRMGKSPADEAAVGVRILTAHQAKGLEFPFVYLVDATDEFFPALDKDVVLLSSESRRKLSAAVRRQFDMSSFSSPFFHFLATPQEHLREERQLLYVAITRASRRLSIHFTDESHLSEPVEVSPFVEELIGESNIPHEEAAAGSREDIIDRLSAVLSREEIESALHAHLCALPNAGQQVQAELDALGLDAKYICSRRPFEIETAEPPKIENHRFSASQLSLYLSCPKRYFYERMLKIAPEPATELDLGQLVHCVLEEFHGKIVDLTKSPAECEKELLEIFKKKWEGDASEGGFRERFGPLMQRATVKRKAEEMLRRYAHTELGQPSGARVVTCEETFDFDVRGLLFRARIDRIDVLGEGKSEHRIIDYKTSQSGLIGPKTIKKLFLNIDQKPDYAPKDFQFPLYLLAGKAAGYEPVELAYYWVAQKHKSGAFKKGILRVGRDDDSLSPEEVEAAQDAICAVANRILAGDFPPAPRSSSECQWCSFGRICDR